MIINASSQKGAITLFGLALVAFVIGILIGHYSTGGTEETNILPISELPDSSLPIVIPNLDSQDVSRPETVVEVVNSYEDLVKDKWIAEKDLIQTILDRIDTNNIMEYHRFLTEQPHVAASPRDDELARYIRDRFAESSFDIAELIPYNVLLTNPDTENPNKIRILNGNNVVFESSHKEIPIHPNDEDPNFIHAFNAFTPAGAAVTSAGSGVVYVNYGTIEDFKELVTLGINITGHIAIARYGKIYRGNKIRQAEQAGAIGIILYSDPEDVAIEGTASEDVYDNTIWLPGTGMQRGSTYLGDGDPLSPGWPSTKHAFRIEVEDADLHKIPSQPLGYADALHILELLDGADAPESWHGGFKNLTYKLGPNFAPQFSNLSVSLTTHNMMNVTRSFNVIGVIKGSIEPDRYVMLGNHRDAWGYGAADPSSGTAQMLETARVFGTLLKEGWRPRRTIMFHSWGAEEFGLIGSREWVEENIDKIQDRTVAYINTDTCASGPMLDLNGSPLLWDAITNITTMVPGVVDPTVTVYDEWKAFQEKLSPEETNLPKIGGVGSGSDYASFAFLAGIPVMDIWFRIDKSIYNVSIYPVYHTGYDTFYWISELVDPGYKIMQGCGRIAALTLKYIADSAIIPYSINKMPEIMLKHLKESSNRDKLIEIYDKYTELENAVTRLLQATEEFLTGVDVNKLGPLELRAINDQLMKLEQSFIIPEGLPGRPTVRHAIFAPSQFDNYASGGFPGIGDLLYDFDELQGEQKAQREYQLKKHISDLTILTDRATSLLLEVHRI